MAEFMKTVLRLCPNIAIKSLQVMKKQQKREQEEKDWRGDGNKN